MGLDHSLYAVIPDQKEQPEAYFRKKWAIFIYCNTHCKTVSDENKDDKYSLDYEIVSAEDIRHLVQLCRRLLLFRNLLSFPQIAHRYLPEVHEYDPFGSDYGKSYIYGLEQAIEQLTPILEMNPIHFGHSWSN